MLIFTWWMIHWVLLMQMWDDTCLKSKNTALTLPICLKKVINNCHNFHSSGTVKWRTHLVQNIIQKHAGTQCKLYPFWFEICLVQNRFMSFFYFEQIVLLFITNSIKKVFFSISNICLSNILLSLCCWKMYLWISGKQASYLGNAPAPAYWKSGWLNGLGSGKRASYWTTEHHFAPNCSIVLLLKMAVHVTLSPFILF